MKKYEEWPYKFKAANGYWYCNYIDSAGVRQRNRSLQTKNNITADKKWVELLRQIDQGALGFSRKPQNLPLGEAIDRYLVEGTHDLAPLSLARHKQSYDKHIIPHFGRKFPLKAIGATKVLAYVRKRQKTAAPNTIYKELAALSAVFNFFLQEELVQGNPVLAIRKPKLQLVRPNYIPEPDEILKILAYLFAPARRFFLALVNTGCRLAEISNANVEDVNLDAGTLRVRRKGGKIDIITLNDLMKDVIKQEFENRKWRKGDPLFLNRYEKRYKKIRGALKAACLKAGVPYCTHHSFRHAYATTQLERGELTATVAKLLGHSSPATTNAIYNHWRTATVRKAAESLQIGKV